MTAPEPVEVPAVELAAAAEEARTVIRERRYTLPSRLYVLLDALLAENARLQARGSEDVNWNNAIDWLLNSRHTADPDIQNPFWKHVDGEITLDELRAT